MGSLDSYLPIFFMIVLGIAFAGLSFVASKLLAPQRPTAAKEAPYECGIVPTTSRRGAFPVRFYLIAMIFVVFDIEIIFLFPWAVDSPDLGRFGLVEIIVFAAAVFVPLVYLVANGALDWGPIEAGPPDRAGVRRGPRPRRSGASGRRAAKPRRRSASGVGLEDLSHNFLTGPLEELVKWARRSSVWPATFGLACCAIEMMAAGAADFDLARFGMEVFRASPRQADLMIVAGRVSQKMAPVLRQVYDQMVEPKWVISMGVCASTGGMFNNYAIVQGVDQIVPVDVYAPGCPPSPQTLIHAILTLHEKIRTGELTQRRPGETGAGIDLAAEPVPAGWVAPPSGAVDVGTTALMATTTSAAEPRRPRPGSLAATMPRGQEVLHVDPGALPRGGRGRSARRGFEICADLCAVDYLRHLDRPAARGVDARALRGRRQPALPRAPPDGSASACRSPRATRVVPTLFDLYPGTENMEREAFDMFGLASRATPTSRGSSCRRTGRVTRCARTTRSDACRCSSRKRRARDDRRGSRGGDLRRIRRSCSDRDETDPEELAIEQGAVLACPRAPCSTPATSTSSSATTRR